MTPNEIVLREQLYHERKDRVFEVLAKCNETKLSVKRCYKLATKYQDKIVLLGIDQESRFKPEFEELNDKFRVLRSLIADHNYPDLRNLHDFVMNSQNDQRFTAEQFNKAMCKAEQKIKDIEQVLDQSLDEYDRDYDRLVNRLKNQRSASPKPKGDAAYLRSRANFRIKRSPQNK